MNQRLQTLGLDKAGERTASPQSCRDSHSLALTWRAVAFVGFARSTLSDTSRASLNFACRAKLTASTRRASSSSGLAETCSEVLSGLTPKERIPDCRQTRSHERASGATSSCSWSKSTASSEKKSRAAARPVSVRRLAIENRSPGWNYIYAQLESTRATRVRVKSGLRNGDRVRQKRHPRRG